MIARLVFMALCVVSCRAPAPSTPTLPAGLRWVQAPADPLQWAQRGFVELVTPVRPPSSSDGTSRIMIFILLPKSTSIPAVEHQGALSIQMPQGAVAARVEYDAPADTPRDAPVKQAWRVLDVRQFEWTAAGLQCSVLRPAGEASLAGLTWACGRVEDARAGAALGELLSRGHLPGPSDNAHRTAAGARLAKLNDCTTCHMPNKLEDRRPGTLVQRATDSAGLFTIRAVLSDESPVERYRPLDTNLGDALLRPTCPDSEFEAATGLCRDGLRARLRLDVRSGVAARDPHALQVCQSRQRLAMQLNIEGRTALSQLLKECQ